MSNKNVKKLVARLAAVQAVYQSAHNKDSAKDVVNEYLSHRNAMKVDGEDMVDMDGALFKKITSGLFERMGDIENIVQKNYQGKKADIEPLLKAIMLCGVYELVAHGDIDAPIIVNDYLNITDSFYAKSEKSLMNGILDAVNKTVR